MQGGDFSFPLYIYPESSIDGVPSPRVPNFDAKIITAFASQLGLTFVHEKPSDEDNKVFTPIDVLDYIYAVLHSPSYRETYKEFLKIDFPRVPYPTDVEVFWSLVKLGGQLRAIHLLDDAAFDDEKLSTTFNNLKAEGQADNTITRKIIKTDWELTNGAGEPNTGRVFINDNQFFGNIPETAFNFYIGGYQPAQKWLKDRQGRELTRADKKHYGRMIDALIRTAALMGLIDGVFKL